MRQKLEKLKNRTERVLQRKYNNELQKVVLSVNQMNDNEKYLDKQFKKSQIAQSIESLNNGKVNALQ